MSRSEPAAPTVIAAALDARSSLAVTVHEGCAELARARRLSGTARELVSALGPELDEPGVARWLLARGAEDEGSARADARRFLVELVAPGAPAQADESGAEAPTLAPEAWTNLARAVLARGHRLRFRAYGRSMRPLIPHGSLLEVEPRAFAAVRLGEVVLHAAPGAPLVAHRVVGRAGAQLVTRGDSNARLDRVSADEFLGVVVARERDGRWRAVSSGPARWLGLGAGLGYRLLVGTARTLVLRPLRATFGGSSLVRASLRAVLRGASGALLFVERAAVRARRPLDVLRAALLSTAEKERERGQLYARKAVQEFTSLEENVRSGLTLLEEVLLTRHPELCGRALVLGCGPGRECLALARRGFRVTGLDREPGMLARAEELARAAELSIRYVRGEAHDFHIEGETLEGETVEGEPFDVVLVFSGLQNMLLPRARRVAMLRTACAHLRPGGSVLVTFLSAYLWPGEECAARGKHFLEALNPEHERGDLYLLNESVHVYPHVDELVLEAREAGLEALDVFRDQRAYDRSSGQVRGYAVLRRPPSP